MIYGDSKVRTMVRSVLPSKYSAGARKDKAFAVRCARRTTNQRLWSIDDEVDLLDFGPIDFKRCKATHSAVISRREGDKLTPMIRWAEAYTADVPVESRLSSIGRFFPKGTIGDHAKGHLKFEDHFRDPLDPRNWWRHSEMQPAKTLSVQQILTLLAMTSYNLGIVNRFVMKAHKATWYDLKGAPHASVQKPRLLKGVLDVDAFWSAVRGHYSGYGKEQHPEWEKAVQHLVDGWRAARYGDAWIDGVFVAAV